MLQKGYKDDFREPFLDIQLFPPMKKKSLDSWESLPRFVTGSTVGLTDVAVFGETPVYAAPGTFAAETQWKYYEYVYLLSANTETELGRKVTYFLPHVEGFWSQVHVHLIPKKPFDFQALDSDSSNV